jgi:hypothetical protein
MWMRKMETSHESYELKWTSPKDNVFAAVSKAINVCVSFFADSTSVGIAYLDMRRV